MPSASPLRLCLVDMNNGVANQATRCFRRIIDAFTQRVRAKNPQLDIVFKHVQPRNLGELPDEDTDLILSSGGPGSPFDGYEDPWCTGYRSFLDRLVEKNLARPNPRVNDAPKILVICHSFEIAVVHFAVATMNRRETTKFGVMPAYMTDAGQRHDFLAPFDYRLFTWEHRNWEAIDLDERKLKELGGALLGTEAHDRGTVNKGRALTILDFAPGVLGTQFHPEADKPGVMNWIARPEHAANVKSAYGEVLYERMVKSLENPQRLARTFALFIPGWLTYRYNEIAAERGLETLDAPEFDMHAFDVAV